MCTGTGAGAGTGTGTGSLSAGCPLAAALPPSRRRPSAYPLRATRCPPTATCCDLRPSQCLSCRPPCAATPHDSLPLRTRPARWHSTRSATGRHPHRFHRKRARRALSVTVSLLCQWYSQRRRHRDDDRGGVGQGCGALCTYASRQHPRGAITASITEYSYNTTDLRQTTVWLLVHHRRALQERQ